MATLKGKTISETYPLLLKIASSGVDGTLRNVEDGDGTTSALQISTGAINVSGTITASGNVDFNGDLDVDGTTNLDVVDIDGAVDMASTLAVADDITLANNKYYEVKDSGGSAIRLLGLDNSNNIYMGFVDDATGTGSLYLRTGGTNALTIDNSQNATFAGNVKLLGASSYARDLTFAHGATNYYWRMGYTDASNGNTLAFINRDGGSEQEVMRMDYNKLTTFSGNVSLKGDSGKLAFLNASGTERAFLQLSSTGLVIDTDSFLEFKPNNTTAMYIDSSGNVGVGTTSPNISGWNANYAVLTIKGDTTNYGGVLELANPDSTGNYFGTVSFVNMDGGSSTVANARISGTRDGVDDASALTFETEPTGGAVTERMRITSGGNVFIGDTANAKATKGLTINQGANDDEIMAFKSSDVAHGMTDISETDTFFSLAKASASEGGINAQAFSDNVEYAWYMQGATLASANTAKSTSAVGVITMASATKTGTGRTTVTSDGNLVVMKNDSLTRFIFDGEGSGHADVEWTTYSDGRLKTDRETIPYGLDEINKLKPQRYKKQSGGFDKDGNMVLEDNKKTEIGFIAQEVKEIIPEIVKDIDESKSFYSLNDGKIVAVLVKALQEADDKIDALTARIEALEA